MKTRLVYSFVALLGFVSLGHAKVVSQTVEYKDGKVVLEGFLAYDDTQKGKRSGVLIAPDWMGVGPNPTQRAQQLAQMGYVAFVADIYGKGVRPANSEEAGALAGKFKADRALMRTRMRAAFDQLKKIKEVGPKQAAIGYCFGGTAALELARTGADLRGVVSFHGGLETPDPKDGKKIRAKVLVLHGADDPFVPEQEVKAFEDEMRAGGVDWQLVKYSKAVHAFTIPEAGNDPKKGAAYQGDADRRSWEAMKAFFNEVL